MVAMALTSLRRGVPSPRAKCLRRRVELTRRADLPAFVVGWPRSVVL